MPFCNPFRLSANAFVRPPEDIEDAKSVIFISAEGTCTEPDYFNYFGSCLKRDCPYVLHVLQHDADTTSDPRHVLELIKECRAIRDRGASLFAKDVADATEELTEERVCEFFDHPERFSKADNLAFKSVIVKMGIDVDYYRYLRKFGNPKSDNRDRFVLVIDRDGKSHSRKTLVEIRDVCRNNHIAFCLSNPCFDLWLLLHLEVRLSVDVKRKLLANEYVSNNKTYSGSLISKFAHHGKNIPESTFQRIYLPKTRQALKRVKSLATTEDDVIDNLGTNIHILIDTLLPWL